MQDKSKLITQPSFLWSPVSKTDISELRSDCTVAVLQPGYLPWLGFFDQMRRSDVFIIYDDVQFDKHGWRNRNRVKSPNGPVWLTVPVHLERSGQLISDICIDNRRAWARKHIGTIRQFYNRAPYLNCYLPILEELLNKRWERIVDLDMAIIEQFHCWLKLSSRVVLSSQLPIQGNRSERLLNVCLHFNAARYLSGNAAQDYLDVGSFEKNGIQVEWQNYSHPQYPQMHGEFVPYLSALDLLLNCGDDSINIL